MAFLFLGHIMRVKSKKKKAGANGQTSGLS